MPQITLNRKVFEHLVGRKLPIDKLKDRISMLGTDLDEVTDDEIKVEIFPNRPDMLSEQGFSRAFSSFIGEKTGLRKYEVKKGGNDYKVIIDKSLKDVRPYTACAIVKNLKFDDEKIREIIQIQEKLHISYGRQRKRVAIGIYPLEKITLPITFKALKAEEIRFQPLESDKVMSAKQILENHPAGKEYANLLKDKKMYPIFIDAKEKILSMPPIINSHDIGKITEKTREVFIECSGFDFDVLSKCLNFIVTALSDMGAEIYEMELDYEGKKKATPDLEPEKMRVDHTYINRLLGLELKEKDFKEYFEKMGYDYHKGEILIPAWRADILHQADLAEDVAIAYGYENFEETIPNVATIGHADDFETFKERIMNILVGLGFIETNTFCIINKEEQTKLMGAETEVVELLNSVSEEYNSLRAWMTPSLLGVLKNNKHHEYPQNIFEAGRVFRKDKETETGVKEDVRLCVALCDKDTDYTRIRQVLDLIFEALNTDYDIEETDHSSFVKGRVARVKKGKQKIAYIGEIHPAVLGNFSLEMPVSALELNLTELYKALQ